MANLKIRRALLSVSDKTGLIEFAKALSAQGVALVSTGGTSAAIKAAGTAVQDVSDLTGFPEMMDGRVKTLHPKVHGGLLAIRGNKDHDAAAAKHGIAPIDLLVVNLYPFEATVAKKAGYDECVENIDIGGPAMIRAASKNHDGVTVIVEPEDYDRVLAEMAANGGATTLPFRKEMAQKAFARTAAYDGAISNWLGAVVDDKDGKAEGFPRTFSVQFTKKQAMRYGENPHQQAAFYVGGNPAAGSIALARQLQGKELSYNNIADTDAALECVKEFSEKPACVIVKHANPCGVAEAESLVAAYDRAYKTDTESAFGGIIAFNRPLDAATVSAILERQFVEVIVAPEIAADAIAIAEAKKNVRLLACGEWPKTADQRLDYKKVNGGLLVQDADLALYGALMVVTRRQPTDSGNGGHAVCVEDRQVRQVECHRLCEGGRDHRHRRRSDEPRQLNAHCRDQGRTGRPRHQGLGRCLGCVLSVCRWPAHRRGSRRHRRHSAGRLDARRGRDQGGRRKRPRHGLHRHAPF